MDSIRNALSLMTTGCWMASLDLKDVYYSVSVDKAYQKYLKFSCKGKLFKYIFYPNGLSTCPRNFTKLLKAVLCTLRRQGHILVIFIDDILIIAASYEACAEAIIAAINVLTSLDFVPHVGKSVFLPTTSITFLGFDLDSTSMKIRLTKEKISKIMSYITRLLNPEKHTIREVAQVIDLLVSSLPAVRYGECHYRALEQDKIIALKTTKGNFDNPMPLSSLSIEKLNWWLRELPNAYN